MIVEKANRLNDVGEYYFSKKLEEVRKLDATGAKIINLGIGSPDLAPSESTIKATIETLKLPTSHGYPTSRGTIEFRKALAHWYQETYSVSLSAEDNVLPLLGSKEGITHISLAFLNPGDGVFVPNPGYPPYGNVSKLIGARTVLYNLEEGSWFPDFEKLKNQAKGVKMMWVNYPNMPTGQAATPKFFEKLVRFGKENKILICHDNPYSLVLNPHPLSILQFDPEFEVTLELNSMSKAFNMPGWRVGAVISSKEVINSILQVKSNIDSGMFLPIQKGAMAALENSKDWHSERNAIYFKRRALVQDIFKALGFTAKDDQVGLFIWAKAPAHIKNVPEFLDRVLYKAHVFMVPGFIFGSQGERYARASLCGSIEVLEEALKRIGQLKPSELS